LLGKYLAAGDLLIDLAWNIDCCELLEWCHTHGVLYINTSVEFGPVRGRAQQASDGTHTVLAAHERPPHPDEVVEARRDGRARTRRKSGLISHFTNRG